MLTLNFFKKAIKANGEIVEADIINLFGYHFTKHLSVG
jgi:hypothetical protein